MLADHVVWHAIEQGLLRFWPAVLIAGIVCGALWRVGSAMWKARDQLERNSERVREFDDKLEALADDVATIKGLLNGGSRLKRWWQ